MINFCVYAIIILGIMLSSFYIFVKSIQYTATISHRILTVAWCLLWAILYALEPALILLPLMCLTSVVFVFFMSRHELKEQRRLETQQILEIVISAYLLSFGIGCTSFYIATLSISFISAPILNSEIVANTPIDSNQPIYLLLRSLALILQLILSNLFFHIRRFKKGFPFIFKKFTIVAALFFTGIILILITWVNIMGTADSHNRTDVYSVYIYIMGVITAGVGIYILIRRLLKSFQRKRAQQNTENHFENLWLESQEEIKLLLEKNKAMSSIIHNFSSRITAMESSPATLDEIQNLKKDLQDALDNIKGKQVLPTTNNRSIDKLFEYFSKQFANDNIDFNFIVNGSIIYMIENVIKQGELETIIVNHLKNAKIAINASDNPFRSITAVIGLTEEHYEFTVFDSGIPFEVDTLIRLGTDRVTTHADNGGSGIGFETTFEILRGCNASLIISEQKQSSADYSKSVSIRFDNKHQYIIETYRSDAFPESERYIVIDR